MARKPKAAKPVDLLDKEVCHGLDHIGVERKGESYLVVLCCTCGKEYEYDKADWEKVVVELRNPDVS